MPRQTVTTSQRPSVGGLRVEAVLGAVGTGVDDRVVALLRPERVEVNGVVEVERLELRARLRRRVARVVEARAVRLPGHVGELHPFDAVGQQGSLVVDDLQGPPVRASVLNRVGDPATVLARPIAGHGDRAVVGPRVRVGEHARRAAEAVLDVEDVLALLGIAREEEDAPAFRQTRVVARLYIRVRDVVHEGGDALLERRAQRQRLEVGEGHRVLRGDELGDGRALAHVRLEPAVGVGDLHAVVHIHVVDGGDLGVVQRRRRRRGGGGSFGVGDLGGRRRPSVRGRDGGRRALGVLGGLIAGLGAAGGQQQREHGSEEPAHVESPSRADGRGRG